MIQLKNSTPTFSEFNPLTIPFQAQVLDDIFFNFDYSLGPHEILLSGSVGSAKSLLMAHAALRLSTLHPNANILLGRRALPDLKDTIYRKIVDHMEGTFKEGQHYNARDNIAHITFTNNSRIFSRSWADKRYLKMRSLELTAAFFEELTENNEEDKRAYEETLMRLGRTPHIPIKFIVSATNPDAPSHWAYKHFIEPNSGGLKHPTRHVYYSRTEDNPFLPIDYMDFLKKNLDPKMARRMLYGEWIEIAQEVVYYAYDKHYNFRNSDYKIDPNYPIILSWDFNIGEGKPMSLALLQYINDEFHIFDEVVIDGARTADTIEEAHEKGLLSQSFTYIICGDASGKHRDTRSSRSDYDIIKHEMARRDLKFEYRVPVSNPPVRSRHNRVNAYCINDLGIRRLFVYRNCKKVDEGLRLVKLKKGASYLEDDSKEYQHCTTAVGYAIMSLTTTRKPQRTVEM